MSGEAPKPGNAFAQLKAQNKAPWAAVARGGMTPKEEKMVEEWEMDEQEALRTSMEEKEALRASMEKPLPAKPASEHSESSEATENRHTYHTETRAFGIDTETYETESHGIETEAALSPAVKSASPVIKNTTLEVPATVSDANIIPTPDCFGPETPADVLHKQLVKAQREEMVARDKRTHKPRKSKKKFSGVKNMLWPGKKQATPAFATPNPPQQQFAPRPVFVSPLSAPHNFGFPSPAPPIFPAPRFYHHPAANQFASPSPGYMITAPQFVTPARTGNYASYGQATTHEAPRHQSMVGFVAEPEPEPGEVAVASRTPVSGRHGASSAPATRASSPAAPGAAAAAAADAGMEERMKEVEARLERIEAKLDFLLQLK